MEVKTEDNHNKVIIRSLSDAVRYYIEHCNPAARIRATIHGDKGPVAYMLIDDKKSTHYCLTFNRGWFYRFSHKFPNAQNAIGAGQSFKLYMLQAAFKTDKNTVMITVNEKAYVYHLLVSEILEYAIQNGTTWTPSTETSEEASVPASMLKRVGCM